MTSSIAEIPNLKTAGKSKPSDNLEKDAIGLDVPVRIHGSQVTAVVLDATEHTEPFEEDTSTMIVFPRGAVVKLKARVRAGHAVVLTNLSTKQTALCSIVQVDSTTGTAHYVKLEFNQPMQGFWGAHFASEGQEEPPPARTEIPDADSELRAGDASSKTFEFPAETLAPSTSLASEEKPAIPAPQVSKAFEPKAIPAIPSPSYGVSENTHRELMPLAAAPAKAAPLAKTPVASTPSKPAFRTASPVVKASNNAIFDSLSTDEDVFGSDKPSKPAADKLSSDTRVLHASLRSLESPALLASEPRKKRSGLVVFGGIAAAIVISAGGWYAMKYRASTQQSVSASAPAGNPVSTSTASQNSPAASPATPPAQANPPGSGAEAQSPASSAAQPGTNQPEMESTITVTPIHEGSPAAADGDSASSASTSGAANVYAGDLTARPKASKRKSLHVAAPPPKIDGNAPSGIVDNSGLSSLVGGASAGLPAPPAAPAAVSGGKIVAPRLIHSVPVRYPSIANANHVEGDVEVQTVIAPTGKVQSAKAISGPSLLREAAVNAVRQWRYSPATLDGKPISIQYMVTVRFHLSN